MTKKSKDWAAVLFNLLLVIPSLLRITNHFANCLEEDSCQAKKGLAALIVLSFIAAPLAIMAWFCFCVLIFFWLLLYLSPAAAIAILLLSHIILLVGIILLILRARNKLFFDKTRNLFLK